MEDCRNILVKMFEESTGQKAPGHVVLVQSQEDEKQLNELEQIQKLCNGVIRQLKDKLKFRQIALEKSNGRSTTEIALLTNDIKQKFKELDSTIDNITQMQAQYRPGSKKAKSNPKQAEATLIELTKLNDLMVSSRERLRQWEEARQNQNSDYNPMKKLSEDITEVKPQRKGAVVQQAANSLQSLDDLLPEFNSIDEAIRHVQQQDAEVESQAARMIQKVKVIQRQVLEHKEMLDRQDEVLADVQTNMVEAKDAVIENRVTAQDIQKRLMKGDKCLMICIIVCLVLIAVYWIYRLIIK